jgi:hypothetical protein
MFPVNLKKYWVYIVTSIVTISAKFVVNLIVGGAPQGLKRWTGYLKFAGHVGSSNITRSSSIPCAGKLTLIVPVDTRMFQ